MSLSHSYYFAISNVVLRPPEALWLKIRKSVGALVNSCRFWWEADGAVGGSQPAIARLGIVSVACVVHYPVHARKMLRKTKIDVR